MHFVPPEHRSWTPYESHRDERRLNPQGRRVFLAKTHESDQDFPSRRLPGLLRAIPFTILSRI